MGKGSIPKACSSDTKMTQSCHPKRIEPLPLVKGDFKVSGEDNGNLLEKIPCLHCRTPCP